MSMCRVFSCGVGRGCLLWPVHFLGKTLLVFALLHSVFQGQICLLLQVFFDFLLLHSSSQIQSVHLKGNESWIFIGRTDAEASILWPPYMKNWLIWNDPDAGKYWRHNRGWDGWIASLTWWIWMWVSFGIWWWARKTGLPQSIGWQWVGHDWMTELRWTYSQLKNLLDI